MDDCIFCQIARGEAPCHKVWEDDKHLAFLGIFPNTKGMTVVIPKEHYSSYAFELPTEALSDLVAAAAKVGKLLDSKMDDVARTAMVFEGYGVDHVHAKLFPLHGTAGNEEWKPFHSSVDKYFDQYEGYVSSHDWKRADDEELAELAAHIRG